MLPPTQLGIIYKFTESALKPNVQVFNKSVKRTSPSSEPWGTQLVTAASWIYLHSPQLSGPRQIDSFLLFEEPTHPSCQQPVFFERMLWEIVCVKHFTEVYMDYIHSLSLYY